MLIESIFCPNRREGWTIRESTRSRKHGAEHCSWRKLSVCSPERTKVAGLSPATGWQLLSIWLSHRLKRQQTVILKASVCSVSVALCRLRRSSVGVSKTNIWARLNNGWFTLLKPAASSFTELLKLALCHDALWTSFLTVAEHTTTNPLYSLSYNLFLSPITRRLIFTVHNYLYIKFTCTFLTIFMFIHY